MRLIVKIGTNVLTGEHATPQPAVINRLTEEIFALRKLGHEVIVLSSGAVAMGKEFLPNEHQDKQTLAAIGQPVLMNYYGEAAKKFNAQIGQLLILRSELTDRQRYDTLVKVLSDMLAAGVLPILNGNDVISLADLQTSDNDLLAGMVAIAAKADKLIILTNQKGLFTADPNLHKDAELVKEVDNVDFEFERLCSNTKSTPGRGGMLSKIRAAKHAATAGIETFIIDGREPGLMKKILEAPGEAGTHVKALGAIQMTDQKRWMLAAKGFGQLIVDDGAVKALRNFKSLLFPGIVSARGVFSKGEIVEVIDSRGLAVGYGKINYHQQDIAEALLTKKAQGKEFVSPFAKPIIHIDHLAVMKA